MAFWVVQQEANVKDFILGGWTQTAPGSQGTITVKGGDTCWALSQQYHTTTEAIIALNAPAINSGCTNLQPGQVIKIPGLGGPPVTTGKGTSV